MTKYLTSEGLEKLKKELDLLENKGRRDVAERFKHAVSFGDLSENAAYDEAREAQSFLENRISELKGTIAAAKVIEKSRKGEIQMGSAVILFCQGKKEEFQIVGPEEADVFCGKISHQSPLGKALFGKKKGDKVVLKTQDGKTEYEILEIK